MYALKGHEHWVLSVTQTLHLREYDNNVIPEWVFDGFVSRTLIAKCLYNKNKYKMLRVLKTFIHDNLL